MHPCSPPPSLRLTVSSNQSQPQDYLENVLAINPTLWFSAHVAVGSIFNIFNFSLAIWSLRFVTGACGHLLDGLSNKWIWTVPCVLNLISRGRCVCMYGACAKSPKQNNKKPNTCSIQLVSKGEQNAKIFQKWETHPCLSRVLQLSWGAQKCGSILI